MNVAIWSVLVAHHVAVADRRHARAVKRLCGAHACQSTDAPRLRVPRQLKSLRGRGRDDQVGARVVLQDKARSTGIILKRIEDEAKANVLVVEADRLACGLELGGFTLIEDEVAALLHRGVVRVVPSIVLRAAGVDDVHGRVARIAESDGVAAGVELGRVRHVERERDLIEEDSPLVFEVREMQG